MSPEIKAKWITALRSGEYKQGRGFLRNNDEYCCLGVLCDLYVKETGVSWSDDAWGAYLPRPVMDWAGLERFNPEVPTNNLTLGNANDHGKNFNEIADLIEAHL